MNFFQIFLKHILKVIEDLAQEGKLSGVLDTAKITAEPPKEISHGDIATNAALVLAKGARMNPRNLAELLVPKLAKIPHVEKVTIAGPGFINFTLTQDFWLGCLKDILIQGSKYGKGEKGLGQRANVEYVSVNPTGPMHAGHGRGAVIGDAIAALLEGVGYKVTREYVINDEGGQVDDLARSVYLRYLEALGETISEIPKGLYPGEYLKPVGEALAKEVGELYKDKPETEWLLPIRRFSVAAMMELIKEDLHLLGIHHEVFTSESTLVAKGAVEHAIDCLEKRGLIYTGVLEAPKGKPVDDWEPRPQMLFKATQFGDDIDRPLQKSDGTWTYFAKDIAYHLDKYERTKGPIYNVFGADHGGYVKRMKAAYKAITEEKGTLDIILCQIVNLFDKGVPVRMSKRSGIFVTLREVIEQVGKDVFRLTMLMRKGDAQFDFDFAKVLEQSADNPVFYIQYAYARIQSVKRQAKTLFPGEDFSAYRLTEVSFDSLIESEEQALIKLLAQWPRQIELAAEALEPHRIGFFLHDVAAAFHSLWAKGKDNTQLRFLLPHDKKGTLSKLALLEATAIVLSNGLHLLGVTPLEEMR